MSDCTEVRKLDCACADFTGPSRYDGGSYCLKVFGFKATGKESRRSRVGYMYM